MGCHGPPREHSGLRAHLTVMETTHSTLSGLEPLLSIEELAEYLDVPVTTIRDWRRSTSRRPATVEPGR